MCCSGKMIPLRTTLTSHFVDLASSTDLRLSAEISRFRTQYGNVDNADLRVDSFLWYSTTRLLQALCDPATRSHVSRGFILNIDPRFILRAPPAYRGHLHWLMLDYMGRVYKDILPSEKWEEFLISIIWLKSYVAMYWPPKVLEELDSLPAVFQQRAWDRRRHVVAGWHR